MKTTLKKYREDMEALKQESISQKRTSKPVPDISLILFMTVFAMSGWVVAYLLAGEVGEAQAAPVPVVEQVVEEVVFNVDGVTCWVGNYPTMVYDTTDSTVKLTITCSDEVVWHYLPAIERTQ